MSASNAGSFTVASASLTCASEIAMSASGQMPQLESLRFEIIRVVLRRTDPVRFEPLDHHARLLEPGALRRVVRHQVHARHAEVAQDARGNLVAAIVGAKAECEVRLDRVV